MQFAVTQDQSDNSVTDLTMLPQTSVPTYLVEETRWHLGAAHRCQIKLVYLSGVRGIPTTPDGARGKPGAFAEGGGPTGFVATPAIHHVSLTVRHRSLNHTLFGMVLPSDQLPKTQRSATEKPKV